MSIDAFLRKSRHVDAAGAALCLVLTLAVCLAGVNPLLQQRESYEQQQSDLEAERTRADRLERALEALRRRLAEMKQAAEEGSLRLRPLATAPLHVAEISQLAARSGLQIDDIQTGSPLAREYAVAVPVHLAGTGTYTGCTLFLNRLREALPETCIRSFALESRGNEDAAIVRINLEWHAALEPERPEHGNTHARGPAEPDTVPES